MAMSDRKAARQRRVEALRARLGWSGPAPDESCGALLMLSGLPGTGKSHLAAALAERYPVAVVRTDEVRKLLFPVPTYTSRESGIVYLTCHALVESLVRDRYTVVFDATNLTRRGRRRARKLAEAAGVPFVLLVTVSPPEVVVERLHRRNAGELSAFSSDADWQVHQKLAGVVEPLSASEPAVIVDTAVSLQPAFDAVEALFGWCRDAGAKGGTGAGSGEHAGAQAGRKRSKTVAGTGVEERG